MLRLARALMWFARGKAHPGYCSCCGPTVFKMLGHALRDDYVCARCFSIPRQRALMRVLASAVPNWRRQTIFESSPSGPASARIAAESDQYIASQFFEDVPSGDYVDGVRREDLHSLTLDDESVDLVITQDVFEHVVDPETAFREIARVLRLGGAHVWTVPIFSGRRTLVRVAADGSLLCEPDYHGNPISDGRSLVVREWGDDIVGFVDEVSGTRTQRYDPRGRRFGLAGPMKDVLVSRKPR